MGSNSSLICILGRLDVSAFSRPHVLLTIIIESGGGLGV